MTHIQVYRLQREHARLEALVREEARRPLPDALAVRDLKKRKLAVKSRLEALRASDGDRAA